MEPYRFGIIGVVMGGPSAEREISLKSGQAVVRALDERGHRVVPLVLAPEETTREAVAARVHEAKCEVIFNALHGTFGEDGTIQQIAEALHLPYTGSGVEASRLAFDKWAMREHLTAVGLQLPPAVRLLRDEAELVKQQTAYFHHECWPFPLIVKPVHQGSSKGVSLVTTPQALTPAIQEALQFDDALLLERHIAGREVTVAIFDEQALPVIEIRPRAAFFDFHSKYHAGATEYLVPAPLDETTTLRLQQAALATHRALGCRHFSRVDLILDPAQVPYVLELNSVPGLTATSLVPMAAHACGCSFPELCEHMVAMALESAPLAVASDRTR